MKERIRRCQIILILMLLCLLQGALPAAPGYAQQPAEPPLTVEQLMAGMSTEQKVGQLFLVTFPGNDTSAESMAAQLVRDMHVGGVVLRASNGNYENNEGTVSSLFQLTGALQELARQGSEEEGGEGPFVPLFIGVDLFSPTSLYADGLPQSGFTRIPSQMAIGATWKPERAEAVGRIVGQELEAVGINLLLGPSLDVVNSPQPEQLGTRTFGGDPYWVGEMGKAFVRGVSAGSQDRLATVARHFPGLGSSDRRPDDELATVQKSLQTLQQEDLPPFFAVTNLQNVLSGTVDGLMTTNLRYRALQGTIRQVTRPISLDATSLPTLINQKELQPWRQAGGILVSDELGALALRRFYAQQADPQGFPARTVAYDAFKAGNDLLFLADFAREEDWQARLENIRQTAQYFVEQYESDTAFATQVDASLRRLLELKIRLYNGDFSAVTLPRPDPTALENSPLRTRENLNVVDLVAQESVTLLYPSPTELADRLPGPPFVEENIVIITDARTIRDCPDCPERPIIARDELQRRLLRRYGPVEGSGRLDPSRITSLTFEELHAYLTGQPTSEGTVPDLRATLDSANWIIFLLQHETPDIPSSDALSRFLRDYGASTLGQKLVVLSFGAPYYLDSTEVSKITAYYGFYTPAPASIDAAARLLLQEFSAPGASPVTIEPLQYRLPTQLLPDANQLVALCLDDPAIADNVCTAPTSEDVQQAEGEIALRTSIIRDYNGNPVPDGTIITFIARYPNENPNVELERQQVPTVNGVARARIPLDRVGQLAISVIGDTSSFSSTTILVDIRSTEPSVVETIVPAPTATPTASPTPRPSATARPTRALLTATPLPGTGNGALTRLGQPNDGFGWWTFALVVIGLIAVGGMGVAAIPGGRVTLVRRGLLVALYGFMGYLLYLLPYTFRLLPEDFNGWGAVFFALLGGLIALVRER